MNAIPVDILVKAITTLLTEAYPGPPDPSSTWWIDNSPDSGILGVIQNLSAEEASTPAGGAAGPGSTIVSNVEHLRWSLANANAAMRGEQYQGNWAQSWHMVQTDAAAWDRLRAELRLEFEAMLANLSQVDDLQSDYLLGVLGLIPHAAFHLGLIRQMIERLKSPGSQS
jgi:hypothetical protein